VSLLSSGQRTGKPDTGRGSKQILVDESDKDKGDAIFEMEAIRVSKQSYTNVHVLLPSLIFCGISCAVQEKT
jgi:hypothetical protein